MSHPSSFATRSARTYSSVLTAALLAGALLGLPLPARAQPRPVLSASGAAAIDGVLSPGEWDRAARVDFAASLPLGGTAPATFFVMNDRTTLYMALRINAPIAPSDTTLAIIFDNAHRGQSVVGDDVVVVPGSGPLSDSFASAIQDARVSQTAPDTSTGGVNNGTAAFLNNGTTSVYEIAHPINSGEARDIAAALGSTVGFSLSLLIQQAGLHPTVTQFPPQPGARTAFSGFGDIVLRSPAQVTLASAQIRTGDGVTVTVEALNFDATSIDLYFGALLPDGRTAVFFSSPGVIGRAALLSQPLLFLPFQTIPPLGAITVPTHTVATSGVPPGVYQLFVVLARQGAFADNRIDANDILAVDLKPLTVLPIPTGPGPSR